MSVVLRPNNPGHTYNTWLPEKEPSGHAWLNENLWVCFDYKDIEPGDMVFCIARKKLFLALRVDLYHELVIYWSFDCQCIPLAFSQHRRVVKAFSVLQPA